MKKFMLGSNYWDSASGTDMWRNWNETVVDKDLQALADCGVEYLRVFPNWRDFQPLRKLYGWQSSFGEYVFGEQEEPLDENPNAIDGEMIKRFHRFAEIAKKYDMKLLVSVLTGWMSGRLFVPPALEGKNLICDSEVLMWTEKYVKALVGSLKDIDNIVMWDLGNECNCLSPTSKRSDAYTWSAVVRNAIYCADNTRPIASGMHALGSGANDIWQIVDQGSICDMMTTHPYPSPTIQNDRDVYNHIRGTIVATAQSEYYSGVGGKPCMIQEQGCFDGTLGHAEMGADYMRANIFSAVANNLTGYLWWCAMEHLTQKKAPYSWSMMERELGLVTLERSPKPVGREMKRLRGIIDSLPEIPPKEIDAICVLGRTSKKQENAIGAYVLAKEAGFNIKIVNCETVIPKAPLYIFPAATGYQVTYRRTWDTLLERVAEEGADLLVTHENGSFTEFEKVFGIRSNGRENGVRHVAHFNGFDIPYYKSKDFLTEATTAEVLATNEAGSAIFTKKQFGKGYIYYLGFPVEQFAVDMTNGLDPEKTASFYKIYREFAKKMIDKHLVISENPYVGITIGKEDDGSYIVAAVNYSEKTVEPKFVVKDGWKKEILYGNFDSIPRCDALFMRLIRE